MWNRFTCWPAGAALSLSGPSWQPSGISDTPLSRLRAARAAGWPDPMAALDNVERAIGGQPSPLPPGRRIAAVWYTTDINCGLPHEQVQEVETALQEIESRLPRSPAMANRGLACLVST